MIRWLSALLRPRRPGRAEPDDVRVINAPPPETVRDLYFAFLGSSWPSALGGLALVWLVVNVAFALAFTVVGGVTNVGPGDVANAFHFSVQTFGTIGYGVMAPEGTAAELLVDLESVTALVLTALATGLLFAKFGRATARVRFSERVTLAPMGGVPTLSLRVGNERGNRIVDVNVRMVLFRTEMLPEGLIFYRMIDLQPVRDWAPALSRSLQIMHRIEPGSPLYGVTPQTAKEQELELVIMVTGVDDILMSQVHALQRYVDQDFAWGARLADVLSEDADGKMVLDVSRFDELEPAQPIEGFPHVWSRDRQRGS